MPLHDWTRVEAGIFHDFHLAWSVELRNALNGGVLPSGYYALVEQHAGRQIPDVISLHRSAPDAELSALPPSGAIAVADAPPQVAHSIELAPSGRARHRTVSVRHVSGHRLVAAMEIVSPSNKDRAEHVQELAGKIDMFLAAGVHVMLVDVFPPGVHDPEGLDSLVRDLFGESGNAEETPSEAPPHAVSYCAAFRLQVYLQRLEVNRELPKMPLFVHAEHYVNLPLEASYHAAFQGFPTVWQEVLR